MITKQTHGPVTWVDAISPTDEEILELRATYALNADIAEDLISPTMHPRIDECDDHLYLVLHFPAYKHSHKSVAQEIDFIIGKDYLLTIRYDTIDSLHWFSKSFEVTNALAKSDQFSNGSQIFSEIISKMYATIFDELGAIEERLDMIEEKIFLGQEKKMVSEISMISRTLLDFKRTLRPHADVISKLDTIGSEQFGRSFSKEIKLVTKEYMRAMDRIHSDIEALIELRETNNTLLFTKQNEVMKVFTILAFTTFPLSLITQIITADPELMWVLLATVVLAVSVMLLFFKHKKWL
jgi:magnesium transporter